MTKDNLDTSNYPIEYQKFIEKEKEMVVSFVKGSSSVLDIACGNGRMIPLISPIVKSYTGIDIDNEYINSANKLAEKYKNVKILNVNAENLSTKFKENEFEKSICLFNSLCSFKNDKKAIREIYKVTNKACFLTVAVKGALNKRLFYYKAMGISFKVDKDETVYSDAWGIVRAYSKQEIEELSKSAGFKVKDIFLIEDLNYGIFLEK
jgi:ubiquinone/menaquinone biosynthesis C-methylase UbiE